MSISTVEEKTNVFLEQFKQAIKKFKHSQEEVGSILGISRSSVSRILQGKQPNLATKLMKEIRLYTRYGTIPKEELITRKDLLDRLGKAMNKPVYTNDAVEFTTVKYIKQEDWKGQFRNTGCMAATLVQLTNDNNSPYVVAIGVSLCNLQHDKFDKKIARDIAISRAKKHWKEYKLKNKYLYAVEYWSSIHLKDEIDKFIQRCMRYYKDKSILHPKIIFV